MTKTDKNDQLLIAIMEERFKFVVAVLSFPLLLMLAIQAVVLWALGQPWAYKGGVDFYSPAWSSSTSQHLIDPYTLSHILHGIVFYWVIRAFKVAPYPALLIAIAVEISWEILENTPLIINRYREETASLDYYGDSILNSVCDTIAAIVGFFLAYWSGWKWSVVIFVAFELFALYLSRDNLTLNVIMLIHPIEWIKQWQLQGLPVPELI